MHHFSSNRKQKNSYSKAIESERWSFQTDELPGSCNSRRNVDQNDNFNTRRNSNINPADLKINGKEVKTRKLGRTYHATNQQKEPSHQFSTRKSSRGSSTRASERSSQSIRSGRTKRSGKNSWLDNLRNSPEIRVPPKAFTSRPKRFKPFGESKEKEVSREKRESRRIEKSKTSHQIERRRIQALVSSCNWDGRGKPDLYIFGKELGKGSFGVVKLAHQKITGQKVAIKVYDKTKFKKTSQIKRCRTEINLMSQLNSTRVTHLFEAFENSKKIYLVMEVLSGGNLCTYVKSKKFLRESEALKIFKQIAEAIAFLHNEMGIVHRDIKLENILFTGSKRIKLADFGFSVFVEDNEENVEKVGVSGTKKFLKSFCGTPSYMAPEIIKKKGYEAFPVDVWSLGVVFFAMLFGRFPFRAKNHEDLYKLILAGKYSVPESLSNEVSGESKDIITMMIQIETRNRSNVQRLLDTKLVMNTRVRDEKDLKSSKGSFDSAFTKSLGSRSVHLVAKNPKDDLKESLMKQLVRFGFSHNRMKRAIINKERNHITATYYLLKMKQARKKNKK